MQKLENYREKFWLLQCKVKYSTCVYIERRDRHEQVTATRDRGTR